MTQNPFDALGGLGGAGGFDMNALLQQAQQMQEQLQDAQERLAETEVQGTVAGGAVTVTVNGVGDLLRVDIATGQFDGSDAGDCSDLGDMVVAAFRDAKAQADAAAGDAFAGQIPGIGGEPQGDAATDAGPGATPPGLGFTPPAGPAGTPPSQG